MLYSGQSLVDSVGRATMKPDAEIGRAVVSASHRFRKTKSRQASFTFAGEKAPHDRKPHGQFAVVARCDYRWFDICYERASAARRTHRHRWRVRGQLRWR